MRGVVGKRASKRPIGLEGDSRRVPETDRFTCFDCRLLFCVGAVGACCLQCGMGRVPRRVLRAARLELLREWRILRGGCQMRRRRWLHPGGIGRLRPGKILCRGKCLYEDRLSCGLVSAQLRRRPLLRGGLHLYGRRLYFLDICSGLRKREGMRNRRSLFIER